MERLKRNPAGWGLMLGGAIVAASTLFTWLVSAGSGPPRAEGSYSRNDGLMRRLRVRRSFQASE